MLAEDGTVGEEQGAQSVQKRRGGDSILGHRDRPPCGFGFRVVVTLNRNGGRSFLLHLYQKRQTPAVLRTHLLMVWRMSLGEPLGEVARVVGYSVKWTRQIDRR